MDADSAQAHRSHIFISYRRADSELAASRLGEDLRRHFAPEQVFLDFTSIDPGTDFVETLQRGLEACAAVLVVIGSNWLAVDRENHCRLHIPDDWVRHEVGESLRRPNVRVFPVLIGTTQMPTKGDLPDDLKPLADLQAFSLNVQRWEKDVAELIKHLQRVPGLRPLVWWKPTAVIGTAVIIAFLVFFGRDHPPVTRALTASEATSILASAPEPEAVSAKQVIDMPGSGTKNTTQVTTESFVRDEVRAGDMLLGLGNYGTAYRRYELALQRIPPHLRTRTDTNAVARAREAYSRDHVQEAATLYHSAFNQLRENQ